MKIILVAIFVMNLLIAEETCTICMSLERDIKMDTRDQKALERDKKEKYMKCIYKNYMTGAFIKPDNDELRKCLNN